MYSFGISPLPPQSVVSVPSVRKICDLAVGAPDLLSVLSGEKKKKFFFQLYLLHLDWIFHSHYYIIFLCARVRGFLNISVSQPILVSRMQSYQLLVELFLK